MTRKCKIATPHPPESRKSRAPSPRVRRHKTGCPFCGRTDVPLCPRCGKRVPHGQTPGTQIPCPCPTS